MKYRINGVDVTEEEFRAHGNKYSFFEMLESRIPPGGHEPYWGTGLPSLASGVPPHQAKEHHEFVVKEGLSGVEVQSDGTVEFNSPGSKAKYLAARGLGDATQVKGRRRSSTPKQHSCNVKLGDK